MVDTDGYISFQYLVEGCYTLLHDKIANITYKCTLLSVQKLQHRNFERHNNHAKTTEQNYNDKLGTSKFVGFLTLNRLKIFS